MNAVTETVRCWLDTANDPSEISLEENVPRTPMHTADQFERFRKLSESKGYGAEEIGARFRCRRGSIRTGLHVVAFACIMIRQVAALATNP